MSVAVPEAVRELFERHGRAALLASVLGISALAGACAPNPAESIASQDAAFTQDSLPANGAGKNTSVPPAAELPPSTQPPSAEVPPRKSESCGPEDQPDSDKDKVPDTADQLPGHDDYGDADNDKLVNSIDPYAHDPDHDNDGVLDGEDGNPRDPQIRYSKSRTPKLNPYDDHDKDGVITGLDTWPLEADHNNNGVVDGEDPTIRSRDPFYVYSCDSVASEMPDIGRSSPELKMPGEDPNRIPDDRQRGRFPSLRDDSEFAPKTL